ncbi:MAG: class I SAM-dependent RNA methyltransferase [Clostridia bacterium]|nr:class I SAM-dependent RNA methyltransferase [Clostridia bacterium]
MRDLKMSAPCLFGLEGLLSEELKRLGLKTEPENGRVAFYGDELDMARANIFSRFAERIQIVAGEFEACTFDELFEGTKAIEWETYLPMDAEFPVKGYSLNSQLHSVPDCQAIVKKAIVERLKGKYKVSWFKETGAKYQIQFAIMKDRVTLLIDTSGEGLHKRGYRRNANEAPLRETLAAALAYIARFHEDEQFIDPMCGSGTILIEAAMIRTKTAPGINRRFAAQRWDNFTKSAWSRAREEARSQEKDVKLKLFGYDISENSVALTLENAKKAGMDKHITAERAGIARLRLPEGGGLIVTNPPYGERMLELERAREIYKTLGALFKKVDGWRYFIISSDSEFEKYFGQKADKRRKLYNGMIKCDYYQYYKHVKKTPPKR